MGITISILVTALSVTLHCTLFIVFLLAVLRARRSSRPALDCAPLVSILKPLAGSDDELNLNLESFAQIDYPEFEILFGVASDSDSALPVARQFIAANPKIRARVVFTDHGAAMNPKVAQLIGLAAEACGDVVVISDSNVRVGARYLWSVVEPLSEPSVGLVTNLFGGVGEQTLGAALENLQVGALVGPSLAAADFLSDRPPTIGKSMAMRRRDMIKLGILPRVSSKLAEDQSLGRIVLDSGFNVHTSFETVSNVNTTCSIERTIERHTRWAKIRRSISPTLFAIEPLALPSIFALVAIAFDLNAATAMLFAFTVLLQMTTAWISTRVLRGSWMSLYYLPLELVRTGIVFLCWLRGWASRRVCWRGNNLRIGRDTELIADRQWNSKASLAVGVGWRDMTRIDVDADARP